MNEIDRVFARFKDDKPEVSDRREQLTIPRRAGATGSRVVEVVHVRSGASARDRPQRVDPHVRAATWEEGFPAKQAIISPVFVEPATAEVTTPTAHVMPAWEPSAEVVRAATADERLAASRHGRGRPRKHPPLEPGAAKVGAPVAEEQTSVSRGGASRPPDATASAPTRRVADPFDTTDDGANCMRCGYAIEPLRERRGFLTCGGCG